MIIDTSAIVALVRREPDADRYRDALLAADAMVMSAGTYLECCIVTDRHRDPTLGRAFDRLMTAAGVTVVAVTAEQVSLARAAYRRYGRGSGHPAKLNVGDCFAYALAVERGEPLLFKGDDFTHTDVRNALDPA